MRLISIEMVGFGKWENKKIHFLAHNQLIFGQNEAGKSTMYQFIQTMLFGFPIKNKKNRDYTPKNGSAYGGRLWLHHPVYGEVQIERFKNNQRGKAKVFYQNQEAGEAFLEKILYPLTKEMFQQVYTIQQAQLTTINHLTEEHLQTVLLSLGISGSQKLFDQKERYQKTAQELYKGKGTTPPLNQKLIAYQHLLKVINEKERQEQTLQKIIKQLTKVSQERFACEQEISAMNQQLLHVEKQQMNWPLLEELNVLAKNQLDARLPKEETDLLQRAYQENQFLTEKIKQLNRETTKTIEEEDEQFLFYLENEPAIQAFLSQQYAIEQLSLELQWIQRTLEQQQQAVSELNTRWHWRETTPPKVFLTKSQMLALKSECTDQIIEQQQLTQRLEQLKNKLQEEEIQLNKFEATHKKVLQNKKKVLKNNWLVSGSFFTVGIMANFFVATSLRYVIIGLCLFGFLFGLRSSIFNSQKQSEQIKKQWQEKLSTLDYLNEQVEETKQNLLHISEKEKAMAADITKKAQENHLGKMNQLDVLINEQETITHYQLMVNKIQKLQHQLEQAQKKEQTFMQQTQVFSQLLALPETSLDDRMQKIKLFVETMEQQRFQQKYQSDDYTKQQLQLLKKEQQSLLERIQPLLLPYQISAIQDIPVVIEKEQKQQQDKQRYNELKRQLAEIFPQTQTDFAAIVEQQQFLHQSIKEVEEHLRHLQQEEQQLLYQKQQLLLEGTIDMLYQKKADLQSEIEELALKWSGYQLASHLLIDILTEISEQQLPNLLTTATDYFSFLTQNTYTAIQLIENQLQVIHQNHQRFLPQELSTGTKDQLILAIRLAFLTVSNQASLSPMILDDGWIHYDHRRKQSLVQLFQKFNKNYQIICFSSDQDMISYYQEHEIIHLEGANYEKNS